MGLPDVHVLEDENCNVYLTENNSMPPAGGFFTS